MIRKIRFNDTEYDTPADMPPAVRAAYEHALELARQGWAGSLQSSHINVQVSASVRFVHNGRVYDSVAELPPDVREKYEKAIDQVDKDHDGIPDLLEDKSAPLSAPPAETASEFSSFESTLSHLQPQPPVISPDRPALPVGALAIVVFLLLVIAGLLVIILRY